MLRLAFGLVPAALVLACAIVILAPMKAFTAECGTASWYGPGFHGKKSASGETYNQNAMTAAHKTLPFGTKLKVTNQKTGKSVTVKINDRGPYYGKRVLDLSKAAASQIGIIRAGTGKVCWVRVR